MISEPRSDGSAARPREAFPLGGEAGEVLRTALGAARMFAFDWDVRTGKTSLSDGSVEIIGARQVREEAGWARVHPDDVRSLRAAVDRALSQGGRFTERFRFRRFDTGEWVWLELHGQTILDDEGAVGRILGVALDVTESERMETALRESESRLREEIEISRVRYAFLADAGKLLSSSLDLEATLAKVADLAVRELADWCVVSMADERGEIRQLRVAHRDPRKITTASELVHRYPPRRDAPVGTPNVLRTGKPELHREVPPELLRKAAHDEEHLRLLHEAGIVSAMNVPILVDGKAIGAISFFAAESGRRFGEADLALAQALAERAALALTNARLYGDVKRAEEQVRQLNASLEERIRDRTARLTEALQELEAFSYTVAHDLRAPLRAMSQLADILLEDYASRLDEAGQDYVRRISRSASRMDQMTRDLLEYSRLARAEVVLQPLEVSAIVGEVLLESEADVARARARVSLGVGTQRVLGNRFLLKEALTNLVGNALKFTRPGVVPEVRVAAVEQGDRVRLWVEDNGIGIDPLHRSRLFRIFERLNPGGPHSGTGIGLAIARKAVERMNGAIGVEGEPGKGSRFWIELPRG